MTKNQKLIKQKNKDKRAIKRINKQLARARKVLARYELGLQRNEHTSITYLDDAKEQLDKWNRLFTKSGNVRKNIRHEKLVMLDSWVLATLVNKESGFNQYKTVKSRTRQRPHIIHNLAKEWGVSEEEVAKFIRTSTRLQNTGLQELLGFDSLQVSDIVKQHIDISPETIEKVAKFLIKDNEKNVPSFLKLYKKQDNYIQAMNDILSMTSNLNSKLKKQSLESILKEQDIYSKAREAQNRDITAQVFPKG